MRRPPPEKEVSPEEVQLSEAPNEEQGVFVCDVRGETTPKDGRSQVNKPDLYHVETKEGRQRSRLMHGDRLIATSMNQQTLARLAEELNRESAESAARQRLRTWEATCPSCGEVRRILVRNLLDRHYACRPCCERHNGGVFSPRFGLTFKSEGGTEG